MGASLWRLEIFLKENLRIFKF